MTKQWRSIGRERGYAKSIATLFFHADEADPSWRGTIAENVDEQHDHPGSQGADKAGEQGQPVSTKPAQRPMGSARKAKLEDLVRSAADLQHRTFDPLRWIVPTYLPEGLTILGGRPKVGKSWLALDVAVAVATGGTCLGKECERGGVLGLFLEDTDRRLQRRLTVMLGAYKEDWPPTLTYATNWPKLGQGCIELIEEWLVGQPNPRLIIIDILKCIKGPPSNARNKSMYDVDYEVLGELQKLAGERQVAILVLHHQRKAGADDIIDTLNATMGLGGCADMIVVLDRDAQGGKVLEGKGRDAEPYKVAVKQQESDMRFEVLGMATASMERAEVLRILKEAGRDMTIAEIAMKTGKTEGATRILLKRMTDGGQLFRLRDGVFRLQKEEDPL